MGRRRAVLSRTVSIVCSPGDGDGSAQFDQAVCAGAAATDTAVARRLGVPDPPRPDGHGHCTRSGRTRRASSRSSTKVPPTTCAGRPTRSPATASTKGIDFEGEFGVVVDDVPMRVTARRRVGLVRLLTLINDVSLAQVRRPRDHHRVRLSQRQAVDRVRAGRGDAGRTGRCVARRPGPPAASCRAERGVVRQSARLGDDVPLRGVDRPRRPHPSTDGRHDRRIGHGLERRSLRGFRLHRRARERSRRSMAASRPHRSSPR